MGNRRIGFLSALSAAALLAGCAAGSGSAGGPTGDLPEAYTPFDLEYVHQLEELGFPSSQLGECFDNTPGELTRSGGETDARSLDLTGETLTEADYSNLTFDTLTVFPDDLPEGFQPEALLEDGKNPGLGLRDLHEAGYTGQGVNVGIVDQPLSGHAEYAGKLRYYADLNNYALYPSDTPIQGSLHGPAVTSLLCGTTTGVAPAVNVYYVACDSASASDGSMEPYAEAVNRLLDLNEILPDEDKMCVISISKGGFSSYSGFQALQDRAAQQGVYLLCVDTYGQYFTYAGRDMVSDPDDCADYRPAQMLSRPGAQAPTDLVYLPMDRRTVASASGPEEYIYYSYSGASWAVPYAAGLYALARQVDPDLSFEAFAQIAQETATEVTTAYDGKVQGIGVPGEITIQVVNPAGILTALGAAL